MAATDPNLDAASAQASQLSEILSLVNGGMRNFSRSQTLRNLQEKQYLAQLEKLTGQTGDEAKAIAKKIKQEEEEIRHNDARSKAIADAFGKTVGALKQFASSAMTSSQSAYNSSEIFSAVAPTVTLMGNTIKAVTDVLATAVSSIPVFGSLFTAADKAIGIVVDLTTHAMEIQLQNAQKLVNTYDNLSKTGLTFGGSLSSMAQTANDSGLKLDTFTKFVGTSAESLHQLGGGLGTASKLISKMGKSVIDTSDQLVVMYGTYDNLDSALATYASRAAGFGTDIIKNQAELKRGARDYLYSLKELQELTGLSADKLKKDQEEREKNSAFQLALSEMGIQSSTRVNDTLSVMSKFAGPAFDKIGTEMIQNNGNIIDATNILTQQFAPATTKLTEQLLALSKNTSLSDEEFQRRRAKLITDSEPQIKAEAQGLAKQFGALSGAAQVGNEVVTHANTMAASLLKSSTDRANMESGLNEILKQRAEEESRAKTAKGKEGDTNTINVVAGLRKSLEDLGMKQDQRTLNLLPTTGKIAETLYSVQNALIDKFLPGMDSVVEKFSEVIDKLIRYINNAGPANPTIPTSAESAKIVSDAQKKLDDAKAKGVDADIKKAQSEVTASKNAASLSEIANKNRALLGGARPPGSFGSVPVKGTGGSAAEVTAGGNTDQVIKTAAQLIYEDLKSQGIDTYVTAYNDAFHKSGMHRLGKAADMHDPSVDKNTIDRINALLKSKGITDVEARIDPNEDGSTGKHIHLEETNTNKGSTSTKVGSASTDAMTQMAMNSTTIDLFTKMNQNMDRVANLLETHGGHLEAIANQTA